MRIGDAAAAAGTTPRALRFYEQRGLLTPPPRTMTGQREYGEREVARVRIIRELLSLGLTVEDVRSCADRLELLDGDTLPPRGGPGCTMSSGVVERRIAALDAEIARLSQVREQLAARARVEEDA
ncbi:MerR family transcriptional regulator [Acrocarpospora macrocephala]|uniref:MerR family transcriptional regulator n=1 Tax=Acrocarpospora macrocephala TaxID=150177 RepID=A0A5M3X8R9_9ACTN|nr:MerR family transcriptional regulator [Acrocarpospora macrocephala]GES15911.1 MerR family transcriptional regulator [Acrocarpospora macrocephala]